MNKDASLLTRISYCLVVLGAILPFGIGKSGWVAMATGPNLISSIPYFGTILFLIIGAYRIYVVIRTPSTLSATQSSGFVRLLRASGVFLLYLGAFSTILGWVAGPLMQAMMHSRSGSGVEFFVIGLVVALVNQIGIFGLVIFELSRLRSFEIQDA